MGDPTQTQDRARVQSQDSSPAQQKGSDIKPLFEAQLAAIIQKNVLQGGQVQLKPQIIKGVADKIAPYLEQPSAADPGAPPPPAGGDTTQQPDAPAPQANAPTTQANAPAQPDADLLAAVPPAVIERAFAEVSAAEGGTQQPATAKDANPAPETANPTSAASPAAPGAPTTPAAPVANAPLPGQQPADLKAPTANEASPSANTATPNAPAPALNGATPAAPIANAPAPVANAATPNANAAIPNAPAPVSNAAASAAPVADAATPTADAANPAAPPAATADAANPADPATDKAATGGDNPPPPDGDATAGAPPPDGPPPGPKTDTAPAGGAIPTVSFVEETNPQPAIVASQQSFQQQALQTTGGGVVSGKEDPAGRSGALVTNAPNPGNFAQGEKGKLVVDQMAEAKPSLFDKEAFVKTLQKKIQEAMPKDEQEAEKGPQTAATEAALKAEVNKAKDGVAGDIVNAKDANPAVQPPEKTPHPGPLPIPVVNAPAVPKITPATPDQVNANVVTPYTAEIDNTRVAKPEEASYIENREDPTFENNDEGAVAAERKQAETEIAATSPAAQGRQQLALGAYDQNAQLCVAQIDNTYVAQTQGFVGAQTNKDAADQQQETTSQQALRAAMAEVHAKTKTDVEALLKGIDDKVAAKFKTEAEAGKAAFKSYVDAKMKAYKDKRYSGGFLGLGGLARRVGDAFTGLPDEVNAFYTEGQKLYVTHMTAAVNTLATFIEGEMKAVAARIQTGRDEIQALVDGASDADKEFAAKLGGEYATKFDTLENDVRTHTQEMTNKLATKMEEEVNALKEDIEAMKAANQGILSKIWDAIAGAIEGFIKALKQIADLLKEIASLIPKIMSMGFGKFVSNAFQAIGQGFSQFGSNIGTHLQKGFITWLCGSDMGVKPMEDMSAKSWLKLGLEVIGLTPDQIKARAGELIGPEGAEMMWTAGGIFLNVMQNVLIGDYAAAFAAASDGVISALEGFVTGLVGDIMKEVMDYMIKTVVLKGIEFVVALLIPGAGFLKAVQSILKFIGYLYENGSKIIAVISNIVKAIGNVVSGDIGGAAALVEQALGSAVPLLIGFLAAILGLDGLPKAVQGIIQKIRKPFYFVIDKIINFFGAPFKAAGKKVANAKETVKDGIVNNTVGKVGDAMATHEQGQRIGMQTQAQKKDAKLGEEEEALKKQLAGLNTKEDSEVTGNYGQSADKQRAELEAKLKEIQAKKDKLKAQVDADTAKTDAAKEKLYTRAMEGVNGEQSGLLFGGNNFSLEEKHKLLKEAEDKKAKDLPTIQKNHADLQDAKAKLLAAKDPEEKKAQQALIDQYEKALDGKDPQKAEQELIKIQMRRQQAEQQTLERVNTNNPILKSYDKLADTKVGQVIGLESRDDKLKQAYDDPEKAAASTQQALWAIDDDTKLTQAQKDAKKKELEDQLARQKAQLTQYQQAKANLPPEQAKDLNVDKLSADANNQSAKAAATDKLANTTTGKLLGVESREKQLADAQQQAALNGDKAAFDQVKAAQEDLKYTQSGAMKHQSSISDKEKELAVLKAKAESAKANNTADQKAPGTSLTYAELAAAKEKELSSLRTTQERQNPTDNSLFGSFVNAEKDITHQAGASKTNAAMTALDTSGTILSSAFGLSGSTKSPEDLAKEKTAKEEASQKTIGGFMDDLFLGGAATTVSDTNEAAKPSQTTQQKVQAIYDTVAKGANPAAFSASQRYKAIEQAKEDKTDAAVLTKVIIQSFISHILAAVAPGVSADKLSDKQRSDAYRDAYAAHPDLGKAMAAHIGKAEGATTQQTNGSASNIVKTGSKTLNPLTHGANAYNATVDVIKQSGNAIASPFATADGPIVNSAEKKQKSETISAQIKTFDEKQRDQHVNA